MKKILFLIVFSFLIISKVQASTEEKIALVFRDPRMLEVVKCESNFRQFDSKGKPLISLTKDVGLLQINRTHWKRAEKLGLDIFNSENDNIMMGKIIYDEQGIKAWTCSRKI